MNADVQEAGVYEGDLILLNFSSLLRLGGGILSTESHFPSYITFTTRFVTAGRISIGL